MKKDAVSRLHRPNRPAIQDLRPLLFWPLFYLAFTYAEYFFPAAHYYPMHCWPDDLLPFCEWFILPYLLWFPFVGAMLAYLFFRNVSAFHRMMQFIILTYSTALLVFFLFPTCQYLRPASFPRQNLLTKWVAAVYAADTSTNVCPSIHVIGSLAVWFAAKDTTGLPRLLRRVLIPVTAILICTSTVFVKQHSLLDVLAALAVCAWGYRIVYRVPARAVLPVRTQTVTH